MTGEKITNKMSRRSFLRSAALMAAVPILAACSPKVVEKIVKETVVVKEVVKETVAAKPAAPGETVVSVLLDSWMCDLMALLPAVQRYNEKYAGKIRIDGQRTPSGWETKVLQMVREGKPAWNAHWHMTQFWDMRRVVETGLVQPIDEYVNASKTPWAAKYKDMTTPQVYEACLYNGKQYLRSDYVSRNVVSYRKDYLQQAGWEKPPDTWDEFTKCARDLKKALGSKNILPIGLTPQFYRSVGSAFLSWVDKRDEAYDSDGKVRYTSEKFKQVLKLYKSWFDEGLTTLDAWANEGDYAEKGMVAMHIGAEFRVPTLRKIWGTNLIDAVNIPTPNKGMPSRCYWEADGPCVFRNAQYPQESTDWLSEMTAWEGDVADVWQQFAAYNFGLLTCYPSLNEKLFSGKPEHAWLVKSEEMVKNGWITPRNVSFLVIQDKLQAWEEKFFSGKLGIDEAINSADQEINAEIDKQLKALPSTK